MFDYTIMPFCSHLNSVPLRYTCDDWGTKTSEVFCVDKDNNQHDVMLYVCLDCGTVFVKEYTD
jgi:hypothetical protein